MVVVGLVYSGDLDTSMLLFVVCGLVVVFVMVCFLFPFWAVGGCFRIRFVVCLFSVCGGLLLGLLFRFGVYVVICGFDWLVLYRF